MVKHKSEDAKDNSHEGSLAYTRLDKSFISGGDLLKGWLYLPEGMKRPPVVVMAHGFGGQRWIRLPAYAEHFAAMGMAVFLFDYRGFNDSEGEPRNYVNPARHLQDWDAAISYVRQLDVVDPQRMALWGTSFSGGHVIVKAAEYSGIKAVISQVPFTDGLSTLLHYIRTDPVFAAKGAYHGIWDMVVSLFTKRRHNVRIGGRLGEPFAMMSQPDSMEGLLRLLDVEEEEFEEENFCPGNIALILGLYRPVRYAKKVSCPTLIIGAEKDSLFPPEGPKKMADIMKNARYIGLPVKHFDPYVGEAFETLVQEMSAFLEAYLQ